MASYKKVFPWLSLPRVKGKLTRVKSVGKMHHGPGSGVGVFGCLRRGGGPIEAG